MYQLLSSITTVVYNNLDEHNDSYIMIRHISTAIVIPFRSKRKILFFFYYHHRQSSQPYLPNDRTTRCYYLSRYVRPTGLAVSRGSWTSTSRRADEDFTETLAAATKI